MLSVCLFRIFLWSSPSHAFNNRAVPTPSSGSQCGGTQTADEWGPADVRRIGQLLQSWIPKVTMRVKVWSLEVNPESIMGDPLVINRPCLKWDFPMKKSIQRFLGYLNLWTAPICFYTNSWSNLNDLAVHPWHPWLCKHPVDFEMGQGPGCENSSFSDRRAGR